MKQKTYALFDLIGVTTAIRRGTAAHLLEEFWTAADAWTNSVIHEVVNIPEAWYCTTPDVFVSTFSDSALMHTGEDLDINDFYTIAREFKAFIEMRVCKSYVVVSRNAEISQPSMPALGGHLIGTDHLPRYTRIAGSGEAWANLHAADRAVQKQKLWHGKYSIYCIGEQSMPTGLDPKDSVECKGLLGVTRVYALE